MSNFLEKIPVSPITSFGNPSVPNGSTFGTNFSILQTGGYMEVYTLSGLTYTIPPATTGIIEFSGNTIPIQLTKGSGAVFSPDVLTLNSDNISSGRRKLGMLVYVYETDKIYQFTIDNYQTLWDNATGATGPGGPTVVISEFGTTIKNNSPEGIAFINAWTASTIEGVNGYDDTNSSWRQLKTGGVSITGGTFNNNTDTLTLNNSTGGTVTITGFTDYYTTGFTFNPSTYGLTIQRNDGLPDLSVDLSILSSDVTITGGTYSPSTGTATFTNNTGGTFDVTGFLTGFTDIYVTGGTYNNNTKTLTLTRTDNVNVNISGFTDVFVTGATKTGSVATFTNNTGGTFTLTGLTDVFVTGGTYVSSTGIATYQNNTGGTFNVSGFFKPSDDIYVSAGTVSHGPSVSENILTLRRNNASDVIISNLVNIFDITKVQMDEVINNGVVIRGKTYKISGCDSGLYDNGTNDDDVRVYTDIYLIGLENNKLSETGIGVFYTPKYNTISIFEEAKSYSKNEKVIWGGYVWTCTNAGTYNSVDVLTLDPAGFEIRYPFIDSNELNEDYNINYDDIIYDYPNDKIIYRNEQNTNIVSTTTENRTYWENLFGFNPIRVFQWGNVYTNEGNKPNGIGNQRIINSYNENINYTGKFQKDFYFNNLSYQKNVFVTPESYQESFYFDYSSFQENIEFGKTAYQKNISLINASYQTYITFGDGFQINIILENESFQETINIQSESYQDGIILKNRSYQRNIEFDSSNTYQANLNFNNESYQNVVDFKQECYQENLNFNNNSYQDTIYLQNNGKLAQQENIDFINNSYQENMVVDSCIQQYFNFNNGYQTDMTITLGQSYINIENGSQINGLDETQDTITIKGYDLDWSSYVPLSPQTDLFFIHNLPSETTSTLIGKKENRLVEVSDLYFDGSKWILNGDIVVSGTLTANTISATTYLNLPQDIFVTGGTYSGDTILFTNNSGGTFSVTGITSGGGTFTGGTVNGETNFTNGLTANTISATTYQNLPDYTLSGLTDVTISSGVTTGSTLMYNGFIWNDVNPFDYFEAKPIVYQKHISIPTFGASGINNVEGVTFSIQNPVARSWADTNIVTRTQRLGMNGATTGTVGAQFRQTQQYFSRNGGFSVTSGFNMAENANDTAIRFFMGIRSSIGTYSNVEPDTLINLIGVCRLSTSNNLHLIHNDATGTATTIDLGSDFPANTVSTDKYIFVLETVPTSVYFRLERVGTSFVYERTITTDLPAADLGLVFGGYMVDTAGANTTTGFDWYGTYVRV
jgi:hypothetical protein